VPRHSKCQYDNIRLLDIGRGNRLLGRNGARDTVPLCAQSRLVGFGEQRVWFYE
jgi:hypothetical protein